MTTGIDSTATEVREVLFGIPLVDLPSYSTAPPIGTKEVRRTDFINYPLLDQILAYVETNPQQWEQDNWFKIVDLVTGAVRYDFETVKMEEVNACGASMCFAGHAALRMGFPAPPGRNSEYWTRRVLDKDGYPYNEEVSTFARNVLGLTNGQADELFAAENTLEDLRNIVTALHLYPTVNAIALENMRALKPEDVSVKDWLNGAFEESPDLFVECED